MNRHVTILLDFLPPVIISFLTGIQYNAWMSGKGSFFAVVPMLIMLTGSVMVGFATLNKRYK